MKVKLLSGVPLFATPWTCISDCLLDISTLNITSESQTECVQNEAFSVLLQTPSSGVFLCFLSKWQLQLSDWSDLTPGLFSFAQVSGLSISRFSTVLSKVFTSWALFSTATTSTGADYYILPLAPLLLPFCSLFSIKQPERYFQSDRVIVLLFSFMRMGIRYGHCSAGITWNSGCSVSHAQ